MIPVTFYKFSECWIHNFLKVKIISNIYMLELFLFFNIISIIFFISHYPYQGINYVSTFMYSNGIISYITPVRIVLFVVTIIVRICNLLTDARGCSWWVAQFSASCSRKSSWVPSEILKPLLVLLIGACWNINSFTIIHAIAIEIC